MNEAEISARAVFVLIQRIGELSDELEAATPDKRDELKERIEVCQGSLRQILAKGLDA
jgi:hypothetical protein